MPGYIFYTGGAMDRAAMLRRDEAWIAERLDDPATRVVPVWRGRNLIRAGEAPEAVTLVGAEAAAILRLAGGTALLGVEGEIAYFATDLSEHEETALPSPADGTEYMDLRQAGARMERRQGTLLAHARGIMHWHHRQRFCGDCGSPTEVRQAGHMRLCTNDACGRQHFPRTDPAVIMLVTGGPDGDSCLLGRQPHWPEDMYSTLAGFVEPGESLEEAVAREVFEESGIEVTDVQYRASQPWPFPSSLMLGFRARAVTTDIAIDRNELEDARWFPRADFIPGGGGTRLLPRKDSISRWLIEEWLAVP